MQRAGNPFENTLFGNIRSDGRLTSLSNLILTTGSLTLLKCCLACSKTKIIPHSGRETSAIVDIDHGLSCHQHVL